jgi:hypothetical protein
MVDMLYDFALNERRKLIYDFALSDRPTPLSKQNWQCGDSIHFF